MGCYKPIKAHYTADGRVVFYDGKEKKDSTEMDLACGQCIGCKLERSRQWAVRIMHETELHKDNSFITLTYDDLHLPKGKTLVYKHYQQFMKDLRKTHKVRFFMCGEYGENEQRPHYHAIIFGHAWREDRYYWKKSKGKPLYRSPELERIWKWGDSTIGNVDPDSAAYVARYNLKKITGQQSEQHYRLVDQETGEITYRTPEFIKMSLKPGIGKDWLRLYWPDIKNGKTIFKGTEGIAPKYYRNYLKKLEIYKDIEDELQYQAFIHKGDNTPERRQDKEQVAIARSNLSKRN